MNKQNKDVSRRRFLNTLGQIGGSAAVFQGMTAMGLLSSSSANAAAFRQQWDGSSQYRHGSKVAILGAGMAGLTAAYELQRAGHDFVLLDARDFPGGRSQAVRCGDVLEETDSTQVCDFDHGREFYFNAGPARIPNIHEGVLHYARELGVKMEVLINDNRGALFHNTGRFGGQPQTGRAVHTSLRGNISELLAKALNRNALDDVVDPGDRENVLAMLRSFGALNSDNEFVGSDRGGIEPGGGGYTPEVPLPPLSFDEIMASDFWRFKVRFPESFHQAATMMQPVGGMDKIARALAKKVKNRLKLNREITAIRRSGDGVRIEYRKKNGQQRALEADYAIIAIPASVLRDIPNDFAPEYQDAIANVPYATATKIAFQSARFWESDHNIYGGISWTDEPILQMWYPSGGLGQPEGILVGSYIFGGPNSITFANLSPSERIEYALSQGEKVHPEYREFMTRGISRAWTKVPYSMGSWSGTPPPTVLHTPDGPFIHAGEHTTYLGGWQEGAVLSAHGALLQFQDLLSA